MSKPGKSHRKTRQPRSAGSAGPEARSSPPEPQASYEVGYGKPPAKARFKKGMSGNPKGRPKRTRNFKTIVEATLTAPISIRERGKERSVTTLEAVLMRTSSKALQGDNGAAQTVLKYATQAGIAVAPEPAPEEAPLTAADQAIFEELTAKLSAKKTRA